MTTLIGRDRRPGARRCSSRPRAGRRPSLPEALRPATDAEVARLAERPGARAHLGGDATLFSQRPGRTKNRSRAGSAGCARRRSCDAASSASWRRSPTRSRRAGFTDAVLLGMGGSSLCPEVLALTRAASRAGSRCTSSTTPTRRRSPRSTTPSPARRRCSSWPRSRAARSRSSRSSATSGRRRWTRTGGDVAEGGRALRRHHRSGDPPRPARRGEALPPRLHQPGRHRRALLGAVLLRPGPGGAARRGSSGRSSATARGVRRRLGRGGPRRPRARASPGRGDLGAAARRAATS